MSQAPDKTLPTDLSGVQEVELLQWHDWFDQQCQACQSREPDKAFIYSGYRARIEREIAKRQEG